VNLRKRLQKAGRHCQKNSSEDEEANRKKSDEKRSLVTKGKEKWEGIAWELSWKRRWKV
jgi:hypothetical protein